MSARLQIGDVVLGERPRIVATGGDAEVAALAQADGADVVELRADLFDDPQPVVLLSALARVRAGGRPIILTVRHATEGGREIAADRRHALYEAGLPHVDAVDIEIAAADVLAPLVETARAAGHLVILSAHDFAGTPLLGTLLGLVARAEALGAHVTKLVTTATCAADLRRLLDATLAAAPRPVVTFAMGPLGIGSRVFFGMAGSLLTYGYAGRPTAPGQLPVSELRDLLDRFYPV
jgi:3-dehydroquinate dehydratase-1